MSKRRESVVLLIHCKDRKGIVARVSGFIHDLGGNILDSDHHTDEETNEFLMRMEFATKGLQIPTDDIPDAFASIATVFEMRYEGYRSSHRTKVGVLVSRQDHCLADLLQRHKRGDLYIDLPVIISNHETCALWADLFHIPFVVCPVTKETKSQREQQVLSSLKGASRRVCCDGALDADSERQLPRADRMPGHRYSPFILAGLHPGQSLSADL